MPVRGPAASEESTIAGGRGNGWGFFDHAALRWDG